MKSITSTLVLLLVFGTATLIDAVAQQAASQTAETIQSAQGELPEGEQKLVRRLSRFLAVPEEELIALNRQGLGWGDVEMAVLIGRVAGQSAQSIANLWLTEQRGWSAIGAQFGISDVDALKGERPPETEESDP